MPNFKKFANGSADDEPISIRHRQIQDNEVGSRVEKVWATDFERCVNREDYEKYISKYGRYKSNKYVSQAKAKIESLDARLEPKPQKEKTKATEDAGNEIEMEQSIDTNVNEPTCLILILRIIGTVLLLGAVASVSIVFEINGFIKTLIVLSGCAIMKTIWGKN